MGVYYDYKKEEFINEINEDNLEKSHLNFILIKNYQIRIILILKM